jgi:hypothetical protein
MYSGTKLSLLLAASLLVPAALKAQQPYPARTSDHHEIDLAVTYSEQYSNLVSTPTFWHSGGSIELSAQLRHGFGLAGNVAGTQPAAELASVWSQRPSVRATRISSHWAPNAHAALRSSGRDCWGRHGASTATSQLLPAALRRTTP